MTTDVRGMVEHDVTSVRERQDPLRERYKAAPEDAAIRRRWIP